MKLVEIATVGKAHGFRGAFVALTDTGRESSLGVLDTIFIGPSPDRATQHSIVEAAWMPKGWKLAVSEILSDKEVSARRGEKIFASREALPAPEENEFYVGDLVGCDVFEADRLLGRFAGVEFGDPGMGDRWWIDTPDGRYGIPANRRFIERVDQTSRRIHLRNLSELAP